MKGFSHDFTVREKIALIILLVILLGALYYFAVDRPVRAAVSRAQTEASDLQTDLSVLQVRASRLQTMKDELDSLNGTPEGMSVMASYNNLKPEIRMLNDILGDAEYSLSFSDVTQDGDQIRRNVALQYQVGSYEEAKQILTELSESEYRTLITDVTYGSQESAADGTERVTVTLNMTFYETMAGGTPDAGLPQVQETAPEDTTGVDSGLLK